jgi:dTDP-4-dehydrorhamnose 3,5-epimerase-like enzyme
MTTKLLKAIPTAAADGTPNGFLLPIWNSAFDSYRPEQVYLTTILPGKAKGPHLHKQRAGAFTCIKGAVLIVARIDGEYREHFCCGAFDVCGSSRTCCGSTTVHIPAGVPAAIYNLGVDEAFVLNMPTPAWRDNSDEHPVPDWSYQP